MRILLSDIKSGSRDLQLEADMRLASLAGRAEAGKVEAVVHVNPAGDRWYLSAKVEGHFPFRCDRCGVGFTGELEGDFTLVVLGKAVEGMDPEENDEIVLMPPSTWELDLSDRVQEALLLDLPMRLLCREDCAGLCPRCGANLNEAPCDCAGETDPRWSALRDLKQLMTEDPGDPQDAPPQKSEE